MPKISKQKIYEFPEEDYQKDLDYKRLKDKYNFEFLIRLDSDEEKIKNFYELVLPSLAIQVIVKKVSPFPRFLCRFTECDYDMVSCGTKSAYVRHLLVKHHFQLPGGGAFLSKSKNFQEGGFTCDICGNWFGRLDNLNVHALRCGVNIMNLKNQSREKNYLCIMWYPEWHKKEFQNDHFEEEITNSLSQIQIHLNKEDEEDKIVDLYHYSQPKIKRSLSNLSDSQNEKKIKKVYDDDDDDDKYDELLLKFF